MHGIWKSTIRMHKIQLNQIISEKRLPRSNLDEIVRTFALHSVLSHLIDGIFPSKNNIRESYLLRSSCQYLKK